MIKDGTPLIISFTSLIHLAVGSVPALLQDNGLLLVQINLPLVLGSSILMPIITVLPHRWIEKSPFCFVKIVGYFFFTCCKVSDGGVLSFVCKIKSCKK